MSHLPQPRGEPAGRNPGTLCGCRIGGRCDGGGGGGDGSGGSGGGLGGSRCRTRFGRWSFLLGWLFGRRGGHFGLASALSYGRCVSAVVLFRRFRIGGPEERCVSAAGRSQHPARVATVCQTDVEACGSHSAKLKFDQ